MVEGRDFYRGDGPPENGPEVQRTAGADGELSQRARYLAKAASLGQIVLEDDAPASER